MKKPIESKYRDFPEDFRIHGSPLIQIRSRRSAICWPTFKTNSLIYELADIRGGESGNLYPRSASVTIVIDEDDMEKFQKRIDSAIEKLQ